MTPTLLAGLMLRELATLARELNAYGLEAQLWEKPAVLPNSAGTLALHLAGNLQHFVGAVLGRTGYVRDRKAEFERRGVPRAELLQELDKAAEVVRAVVPRLSPQELDDWYPLSVGGYRVRTGALLLHLALHLAYHVGQVDYHRRIVTGMAEGVGAVALGEIPGATPVQG
jgi:uncharacterized damage-inducible protein DinB